ncbi:MAG: bis(5'-nucleosyl)-tetraphosphatase (symmetrical) YqeK [Elusimicrobia bacterium]|nr:bis(5'-nucleosyl)-tetraphosphatase (symmetrical) YqeK [Elusimicrobiota bacterium]
MPEEKPVIIYGGSFDPPHKGHIALAAAALRELKPRALFFVPGFRTPFKDLQPLSFGERALLLKEALRSSALAGRREVAISSFEAAQRRVVYTYETLAHFRKLYPRSPLYFLMGSDCLAGFGKWKRRREILKKAVLLAGLRPGYSMKAAGTAPFRPLKGLFPRAASSSLRGELFLGGKPPAVPRGVLRLIERKGLYLARERALLKGMLSARRFRHSLETARLALELAPGLGLSPQKAALAGLLHDCARELKPARLAGPAFKARTGGMLYGTIIKEAPVLLHAWAGAEIARAKFGVKDREMLEAVSLHATGAPGMGTLARLIYVADLAAAGRDFAEAGLVRELAGRDFAAAFRAANYVKLSYAFSSGGWVHPLSVSLWNSLQEKKKG